MNCKRVLSQRSQFLHDCSPVLLEPCKAALDDPKLGYDLLTYAAHCVLRFAFCVLHCDVCPQYVGHALRKGLAHIAAVAQHALHLCEARFAAFERLSRSLPVSHLGNGRRYCVWQVLSVHD